MDPERSKRIDELLGQAIELETSAQAEFLERACAGDARLLGEVVQMLVREFSTGAILKHSPASAARQLAQLASLRPGEKISHYRVLSRICRGGMGEIWKARDEHLDRDVAIKILPPEFSTDAERVQRFQQEAFAISALNHPNIITIYDVGQSDELHFIVTEWIEGQTLRAHFNDSPRGWREPVLIATQVAGALNAAHAVGIIHRDIKPENLMVLETGLVKVLDFGIAKWTGRVVGSGDSDQPLEGIQTRMGARPGTLKYMSPEQANGEDLDPRTDIFSLGLVLYEMISRRHPYVQKSDEEIVEALKSEDEIKSVAESNADIPAALDRIVGKALRKKREERYASGSEMLADLEGLKSLIEVGVEKKQERLLRAQNANQLLTQFVVFHDARRETRIPLGALWVIRRFADLKRGKLERQLVKKSLISGLASAGWKVVLVAAITMLVAAAMSVSETWDERILRDGHTAAVRRAVFSPDGKLLVTAGEDKRALVWDFKTRERLKTLAEHTDWITSVAFSPDSKWIATASLDRTVIVWDATLLEKAALLRGHSEKVSAVAFSPDSRLLVSSSTQSKTPEKDTLVWRVGDWERVGAIPRGSQEPHTLFFSADSRRLIFHYGTDNTWDLSTGRPAANELDPSWGGNSAAFSPDGKYLVSVNSDGEVIFVDTQQRSILHRNPAHQDNGRAAVWSPSGELVATGAEQVILWDGTTMRKIAALGYPSIVWGLAFSPDSRWLVSTHGDGAVLVWDMAERRQATGFNEHSGSARAVAFSTDGRRLASASEDRSVIIWNRATALKETTLLGHDTRVSGLAFSPSGEWLASVDRDGKVIVWDLASRQPRQSLAFRGGRLDTHCLAVSPNGRWVAVSNGVFETTTGRPVVRFHGYQTGNWIIGGTSIYGLSFSADGRWLALAEANGKLFLWDASTWQIADAANIAPAQLISVSFSPDSQWLATGEDHGTVRLWATSPLRPVADLGRHSARVKSVAFSPDGREIVSASDDKTIRLWNVRSRKLVTRIGTHTSPVLSVAFSPDAKQIASGEYDHSVRLYTRHRELWGWRFGEVTSDR